MFCPFCGSSVPDNVKFCPSCGGDVAAEMEADVTSKPSEPTPVTTPPAAAPPAAAPPVTAPPAAAPPVTTPPAASAAPPAAGQNAGLSSAQKRELALAQAAQEGLGMGWYKFMIYFQLFAGAVLDFFLAFRYFGAAQYLNQYAAYGDPSPLYPMFIILGIASAVFGILSIYCRMLLARFSKKALTALYVMYGINIAIGLIAFIGANTSGATETSSSTAGSIAVLVVNVMYYKKRAHLFVND